MKIPLVGAIGFRPSISELVAIFLQVMEYGLPEYLVLLCAVAVDTLGS